MDINNLNEKAEQIQNENGYGKNTATRVGSLFLQLITWFKELLDSSVADLLSKINLKADKDLLNVGDGTIRESLLSENVQNKLVSSDLLSKINLKADKDLSNVGNGTIEERLFSEDVQKKLNTIGSGIDLNNYYTKTQTIEEIRKSEAGIREDVTIVLDELAVITDQKANSSDVYTKIETDSKVKYSQYDMVTTPLGEFAYGDNLEGLSFETIIKKILCKNVFIKLPSIESLTVDDSNLQHYGQISITIHRTPGSGMPTYYAVSESASTLTDWKTYTDTLVYQLTSQGEKTVYVRLKNEGGESYPLSVKVTWTP